MEKITNGKKFDQGKLEYHLVPFEALEDMVKVLMFGKEKYGEFNWKTLPDPQRRYLNAALRHLTKYSDGEIIDTESGINHLAHAQANLLFLMWFTKHNKLGENKHQQEVEAEKNTIQSHLQPEYSKSIYLSKNYSDKKGKAMLMLSVDSIINELEKHPDIPVVRNLQTKLENLRIQYNYDNQIIKE